MCRPSGSPVRGHGRSACATRRRRFDLHDNEAVGTSGDYQRYFMKEGKRDRHIIDPRAGQSIDLVASVSVITSGGTDAGTRPDGNSKPLFIAGPCRCCPGTGMPTPISA